MQLHSEVAALLEEAIRLRQSLHRIPGTGFDVQEATEFVKKELEKYSPDEIQFPAETGIKAVYYAKKDSEQNEVKTIAFRADMDGLSIEEISDAAYKSENTGKMHACGHDGHMTIVLLLARIIHAHRDEITSNVVLIFQPAEEGRGGATRLIEEGALKAPDVDMIYGMHLWPDVPKGKIGIRWGPMMAKTCAFDIIVHGLSSHGANPQLGVDAVVSAASLISILQTAITRNIDPHQGAVLTIGRIEGGVGRNIIADKVEMNATLRVFKDEVYNQLMRHIYAMAEGLALATDAHFEIIELIHHPCVDNQRKLVEAFYEHFNKDEDIVLVDAVMVSEDFSCFQQEVPGLFMFLGIGGGKNRTPLHSSTFDFDEDALLYGVEIYRRILGIGE